MRTRHTILGFAITAADDSQGPSLRVPLRTRNAKMDALVRKVHQSPKYSFSAACKAVSDALRKAKVKA